MCVSRGHCARKASGYSDVSAGLGSDPLTPFVRAPHFMDLNLMGPRLELHRVTQDWGLPLRGKPRHERALLARAMLFLEESPRVCL